MPPVRLLFLTLFLGLVTGEQVVNLGVEGSPARIELRLDGQLVAAREHPPWRWKLDLGAEPRPRELVANAFDREGLLLSSERQFLNLSRPPAEVQLLLERDPAGVARAARVAWGTLEGGQLPQISIRLDGKALVVDGTGRAALPAIASERAQVLSAEVRFSPTVSARRDLVLGGEWREEFSTEVTAMAITGAPAPQAPADLAGAISIAGRSVSAVGVEKGPAQVILVRGTSSRLASRLLRGTASRPEKFVSSFGAGSPSNRYSTGDSAQSKYDMRLGRDDRVRILWPVARRSPGASLPTKLFDATPDLGSGDGGFPWLLTRVSHATATHQEESLIADAVAVAGLQAVASGRRRAVVLFLADEAADASAYTPAQARAYLESVRVPLVVWSLRPENSPLVGAWGPFEDVSSSSKLRRAVDRLREQLDAQRVVWLPGLHVPATVELAASARARGWSWAGEG